MMFKRKDPDGWRRSFAFVHTPVTPTENIWLEWYEWRRSEKGTDIGRCYGNYYEYRRVGADSGVVVYQLLDF